VENLAIMFADTLTLAFVPSLDIASFIAGGTLYRDVGAGHLVAHYDRLLDANGKLVGLQLWANPEAAGLGRLLDSLPPRPYLMPQGGSLPVYHVFFRPTPPADLDSSGDQAFGGQLFRGSGGQVALTIDLEYLIGGQTESVDMTALRDAAAIWTDIRDVVQHRGSEA
jgi:hypothetical protein